MINIKRFGRLYDKIFNIENLKEAHKHASKGKKWYKEVKMVNGNPDLYLTQLQEELIQRTYHTSGYEVTLRNDGVKEREIYKLPYYPDRIVHWAIIQIIEPMLMRNFILDTYSAIPGRGVHFGMKRVKESLKDREGCKYCLKLDIKKYYPSIKHDILKEKYRRLFKDKALLWLLDEIIDSVDEDKGVPIGNYLSQYSGNFYLSSFDHWIKEVKGVKHYHRYMDDIVIFGNNKEELRALFHEIQEYLQYELGLTVKENWQIFPTYVIGVDFLGYRFFGDYILLRKRTCSNMKKKLLKLMKKKVLSYSDKCSIHSYEGWLIHCDGYRLSQKYIKPLLGRCL